MKQTAVEWLEKALMTSENALNYNQWAFNKAKEMEKEQIVDAALELNPGNIPPKLVKELAEQYYNKTFKSE